MNKLIRAAASALLLAMSVVGIASAHHVISLSGTVDCAGNWQVNVSANVFGDVTLTTTLNGDVIGTETPGGGDTEADNYGNHDFMYSGTGASAGDPITANVSDNEGQPTEANLVLTQEVCATPTPTPSASVVTRTSPPTPHVTPPPTSTDEGQGRSPDGLWLAVIVVAVLLGVAAIDLRLRARRR